MTAARLAARSIAEIVTAECRIAWAKAHDGADCPAAMLAAPPALAAWLPECPADARAEADALLPAVVAPDQATVCRLTGYNPEAMHALDWPPACEWTAGDGALLARVTWTGGGAGDATATAGERTIQLRPALVDIRIDAALDLALMYAAWLDLPEPRPRHPLAPLVDAWQRWKAAQPVPKRAVDTDDYPNVIVPRSVAMVNEHAPSYYLRHFNGAAHRNAYGQLTLGFEHPDMDGPTLPANIWTLQLAEAEKRGRGLPAALRAFLAAIVHVPLAARRVTSPTDPPVVLQTPRDEPLTLRHFLPMVYSGRTRPGEYWHVLHGVRAVLHSEAADVPYEWNGRIWTRSVVRMDGIPEGTYDTAMLDEPWPVSVWLPPGDGTGPAIAWALLLRLMCNDPAAARLLINLAYRWHIEGKRLYPVGKGKKRHWLHHPDPTHYDRFTAREADLYPFPPGTGQDRRDKRIADGWDAVERLIKAGGAVHVDGRLLPPLSPRAESDANPPAPPPDSTA